MPTGAVNHILTVTRCFLNQDTVFFATTETQFTNQTQLTLQPNSTDRHDMQVDAAIMWSFSFHVSYHRNMPGSDVGQAAAKHWWRMPKWQDCDTVNVIIFHV